MSLEKIQLPHFLIADLYKDCIVELESIKEEKANVDEKTLQPIEAQAEVDSKLKFLGQNEKHITVVVNTNKAAVISESDLSFLANILKACGFNLGHIAIVNKHGQDVQFSFIKEQLAAKYVFLFNVDPTSVNLPFTIPHFQVHNYDDTTILTAPSLSDLNQPTEEGRLLKTKLWMSLKKVFNLS